MRWLVFVIALASTHAYAETRRMAIVLGNNVGNDTRASLHYAELDATKLSQALLDLGGVEPADLHLLHGTTLAEVSAVFARATKQVAAWRAVPDTRVVLLFYYSGHSDGEALELGADRLGFVQLRRWLADTGADVRVVIVDSCKSGAMLAVKGGRPGRGFQIRLTDTVTSNGEALLTSSAADEIALESKEIRGSFFTHHLVSGLRGAADLSGDGNVTLGEAYQYAFARTVSATSATMFGPQHPAYDYRLTGEGELVLASHAQPSARITLPEDFDRVLLVHRTRDQVIAEIPRGAVRTLAVPPATYTVRGWRKGIAYEGVAVVQDGRTRMVLADELTATKLATAVSKGSEPRDETATLAVVAGWQRGVARAVDLRELSISLGAPHMRGWGATLDVATDRGDGFRETQAGAYAGYAVGRDVGRLRGDLGLQLGGGFVMQRPDDGGRFTSLMVSAVPRLGLAVDVSSRFSLRGEVRLSASGLKVDREITVAWLYGAYLGVAIGL
jgi:hypothetical protein